MTPDDIRAERDRLRDIVSADHRATGGHCPVCPGDESWQQPDCTHRQRWCITCYELRRERSYPCSVAKELWT